MKAIMNTVKNKNNAYFKTNIVSQTSKQKKMCRRIYLTKGKNRSSCVMTITSINDYCSGNFSKKPDSHLEYFDDMTSNFDDLGYWDCEKDLDGKNTNEVSIKLTKVLEEMGEDGITSYLIDHCDKETLNNGYWQWGNEPINGISGRTKNMKEEDRKQIIFHHLEDLLMVSNSYDKMHYFFLEE